MTSATAVYASTWYAATAYQNLGTSNNTVAATFTYQGAEGNGGVAVERRWNDSSQEGDFAFVNTGATPPVIALQELTGGWTAGTSANSSALTLTAGSSYTLTITDNGTTVTAYLYDDVGLQSCNITPTLSTSNQEAMFGWLGTTASFTFASPITAIATQIVATPTFSPGAGTYTTPQSVTSAGSANRDPRKLPRQPFGESLNSLKIGKNARIGLTLYKRRVVISPHLSFALLSGFARIK